MKKIFDSDTYILECDFCKKLSRHHSDWSTINNYEELTSIEYTAGSNHPYHGKQISLEYDICPTCFHEKVLPFLKAIAVNKVDYTIFTWNETNEKDN